MKNMFLAALVAFTAAFAAPQKSEALIVAAAVSADPGFFSLDITDSAVANLALCILILPICALDEKASTGTLSSTEVLLANGYSTEESQLIVRDQKYLFQTLASKKLSLKVAATDTVQSLRQQLDPIAPGVSDAYLNFLMENR